MNVVDRLGQPPRLAAVRVAGEARRGGHGAHAVGRGAQAGVRGARLRGGLRGDLAVAAVVLRGDWDP